jgi:hypothetical protein
VSNRAFQFLRTIFQKLDQARRWLSCAVRGHDPEQITDTRIPMNTVHHHMDGMAYRSTGYFHFFRCRICQAELRPLLTGGCRICGAAHDQPCDAGLHG